MSHNLWVTDNYLYKPQGFFLSGFRLDSHFFLFELLEMIFLHFKSSSNDLVCQILKYQQLLPIYIRLMNLGWRGPWPPKRDPWLRVLIYDCDNTVLLIPFHFDFLSLRVLKLPILEWVFHNLPFLFAFWSIQGADVAEHDPDSKLKIWSNLH